MLVRVVLFAGVVFLLARAQARAEGSAQSAGDWELGRAHFYSQAGGDTPRPDDGFLVADRPGYGFTTGRNFVRFWSEFRRYGSEAVVGYPASRTFVWDGFDVQVFQKGVFQWRPEQGAEGQAWFMNVFDEFTRRGLDGQLLAEKQVPLPGSFDDRGKSFDQITAERLALLNGHPALLQQYRSVPDPMALYGLPNSAVQDLGPFYAIRLQRAAFQEWKVDAPGIARAGQVTVVNAGDVAKQYGLIPAYAMQPLAPPAPASEHVAVFAPGRDESVAAPFTVAGDARAFEARVLWELTDAQRGDVLARGATNARACCEWSSFEFEVQSITGQSSGRATLAVWGAPGRDASERPGEVRVTLNLQSNGGTPPGPPNQPPPVQASIADAAQRTGLAPTAIQVLSAEPREWSDSSLGCPQPGKVYLQVITPGWMVVLRAGQQVLEYHTDSASRAVLCTQRSA